MLCSQLPRNTLLISGVVISHLLVLLGLLWAPLMRVNASVPGTLIVSLLGDSAPSAVRQKSDAAPPVKASSNAKTDNLILANTSHASGDSEGNGHSGDGAARLAMHSPKPHYPLASRRLKEQGLVVVRLCVNDQGIVEQTEVSKSSGFEGLDQSALKALALWKFIPVKSSAISVSSQCFQTPVQFTLEG